MSVQIKLASHSLQTPELEVLKPDNQNYRCLLLQPSGPIYADTTRIGHLNTAVAELRCRKFIELASANQIELVVTPEYCMPWTILQEIANGENFPSPGRLWVLGCESTSNNELAAFKDATSHNCNTLHEDIPPQGTYLDPVAFCFQTQNNLGNWQRVILLQFKTCPSRDEHFLENEHLRRGRVIYQFHNQVSLLKLSTIICSDAFAVADQPGLLASLTDRSILIHIQLNQNPRHIDYRNYRRLTFSGNEHLTNCDIICLNWAQKIELHNDAGGDSSNWNNIAGSAWYLPKNRCSNNDLEILRNHKLGLYYSFMEEHRHALLFHYDEAIFQLTVPKPFATGAHVIANNLGPLMVTRRLWNITLNLWEENHLEADSGLMASIESDEDVKLAVSHVTTTKDALAVERSLALACGATKITDQWFKANLLDSCLIGPDEILRRITFTSDDCEKAESFRHERLQRAADIGRLLRDGTQLPPQVHDIQNAKLDWSVSDPNCNVHKMGVEPAIVVYLGPNPQEWKIKNITDSLLDLLRREGRSYMRRLAVYYRQFGVLKFAPLPALTRIDFAAESMVDITEPLEDE